MEVNDNDSDLRFVLSLSPDQFALFQSLVTIAISGLAAHDSTDRILQRFGEVGKQPRPLDNLRRDVGNMRRRIVPQPQQEVYRTT